MSGYGVITFGGHGFDKPLGTVTGMRITEHAPAAPTPTFAFTAKIGGNGTSVFEDLSALFPEPAPAVMSMSMSLPCGILGTVEVKARVTGSDPMRETAEGSTLTMRAEMEPRLWRRAVSMAVEKAIADPVTRNGVAYRAMSASDDAVRRLACDRVRRFGFFSGGGERKARKAMRRLLRAAGVTRSQ